MAARGIAFSVRCLMADAYEDGRERGCAESRTQALEDMKPGTFGDHVDRPQLQWPPPILRVSNDRGDGGDIRGGQDVDPPSPARGYSSWKNSSTVQVSSLSVGSSSGRRSARPVVPVLACQSAIARRSGREV